jgi:hypothetical protein
MESQLRTVVARSVSRISLFELFEGVASNFKDVERKLTNLEEKAGRNEVAHELDLGLRTSR